MKSTGIMLCAVIVIALLFGSVVFAQSMDDLTGTQWQLSTLGGADVLEDTNITLVFDEDGRSGGSSGCNTYGSGYEMTDGGLSFTNPTSTMMACSPQEVMEQEQAYFAALIDAKGYEMVDGQLVIIYGDGQQLIFNPMTTLDGTSWQLVALGDSDVVGNLDLTFGEDGRVSGSGGCNVFNSAYVADGSTVTFEPLLSTRRACIDTASSEQETAYFAALEAATSYELADGQLTITYGEGEQLVFAPQSTLAGTQWVLVSNDGTDAIVETTVTLEFTANGEARGNTGCNIFRTPYTVEGDALQFSETIVTTRRACVVEGANQQEQRYLEALTSALSYTLAEDQLVIIYGDGQQLIFAPAVS
jgi:heat shock protein HslJ